MPMPCRAEGRSRSWAQVRARGTTVLVTGWARGARSLGSLDGRRVGTNLQNAYMYLNSIWCNLAFLVLNGTLQESIGGNHSAGDNHGTHQSDQRVMHARRTVRAHTWTWGTHVCTCAMCSAAGTACHLWRIL